MNAEPVRDYANELELLQLEDDVNGNGLFDPPGSHGNVHADYGVFADHVSLPGYVARARDYAASEVRDVTTGEPVMYVPGGAVSIDRAQQQAFRTRLLWELPPGVNPWSPQRLSQQSTVEPVEPSWPVGQTDTGQASPLKMFALSASAGLAVGLLLALVLPLKGK
jgi:hypothetical protein